MTEATADGDYDTADSQVISVAAGAVTAIAAAEASTTATDTTAVAALRKEFDELKGKLATAQAEVAQLKKLKPAMPTARKAGANADAPDPKAKAKLAGSPDAGTL